ncbi:hypothetical protein BegalDRAFT_3402 [Beggiatoa alba B18LD]|uniref:Uncharacterized protein n=1 Tax=Beggiatoa alba B18LD TaxID=395493 RepID=I3CKS7_9GAMM|nr:hypothetical protein BegalDRAFT_3402 [Beggiatoa alba B18LD]
MIRSFKRMVNRAIALLLVTVEQNEALFCESLITIHYHLFFDIVFTVFSCIKELLNGVDHTRG